MRRCRNGLAAAGAELRNEGGGGFRRKDRPNGGRTVERDDASGCRRELEQIRRYGDRVRERWRCRRRTDALMGLGSESIPGRTFVVGAKRKRGSRRRAGGLRS